MSLDMDGLEVIGSGQPFTSITVDRSPLLEEEEKEEELREAEQKESHDPLAQFDDVMLVPVFVPSLIFCGQRAQWTGNSSSHKGEVGINARVMFEASEGERVTSDLKIHNEGSTAVYYSWQQLPAAHSFPHTHTHTHTQHFYFNTSTGVLLPGESQTVGFIFKSERAGVWSEVWRFNTHPLLMGGASLQVTLRGVALCQDRTATQRLAIQRELEQRVAVTVCRSLLCDVLRGVQTPERPSSPAELYTTEEERFVSSNPRLQYQYETVEALKALWQQVAAAGEPWDLSVTTLRQVVLALPQGEDGPEAAQERLSREGALEHYNSLLLQLARPQLTATPLPLTSVGVQLWRELLDSLVSQALWLRHTLGLPDPLLNQEARGMLKKDDLREEKRVNKEEEKKGAHKPAVKEKHVEEHPPMKKKGRGEEVGVCPEGKEVKEALSLSSNPGNCYQDQAASGPEQPRALEQYHTQLHQQVYVLMEALVDSLCEILEETAEI